MEILYSDDHIIVCIKPPRVLSTDEPGGMPSLVRDTLGISEVRTVHRLDRVVSGLMVLTKTPEAASELSRQIREDTFEKEYLAVVHGKPAQSDGTLKDLLLRNKQERKTYVVHHLEKGVQEAVLDYQTLTMNAGMSRVRIQLITGRTHQIRAQFSSRGLPLVGDRKYSTIEDDCQIALWSYRLAFTHPATGEYMEFIKEPPEVYPWTVC